MGSNRRYAAGVAAESTAKMYSRIAAGGTPETLTEAEIDLVNQPMTRSPIPRAVIAWVHYGREAVRVRATTVSWTPRAVAIKWQVPGNGIDHRAWIWADAVIEWLPVEVKRGRLAVLGEDGPPRERGSN